MDTAVNKSRVNVALWCIHISAVLYLIVGVGIPFLFAWLNAEFPEEEPEPLGTIGGGIFIFGICLAMIIVVELIASSLRRVSFKGWVAALILFAIYTASLYLPLGVVGLWALLSAGTREQFGIRVAEPAT